MESTACYIFVARTLQRFNTSFRLTGLLHVVEGDHPVLGLPLLVGKLSLGCREELFVQVRCLFDPVEFVVRRCRQEERGRRRCQHFSTKIERAQGGGWIVVS